MDWLIGTDQLVVGVSSWMTVVNGLIGIDQLVVGVGSQRTVVNGLIRRGK